MTDPYSDYKDLRSGHADEKENYAINTIAEVYTEGINYLKLKGYKLVPDVAGEFVMHRVYKLSRPEPINGIKFPRNFKYWKQVAASGDILLFQQTVQQFINKDYELHVYWKPFIEPDMSKKKPMYAHAQSLIGLQATEAKQKPAPIQYGVDAFPRVPTADEFDSEVAPRAFVPPVEWFNPVLHSLTLDTLLSLFPLAERKLLALTIGRAVVGRSNAITPSGRLVKHTSRMAALILGKDPGLGKSTLFDKLWAALESTGYIVETFSKMGARFNLGPVATADIIYKDDITQAGLKSFVESENTKIIITGNGLLKVEDKGINAVNVQPCGVIFLNTNEFNPRTAYGIDPGTADRIKILSTLRKGELTRTLQDVGDQQLNSYPELLFPELAKEYGVSETALMLWLSRLCADYFWETIQPREDRQNGLKNEVHFWTHRLRVPLHKNATTQVLSAYIYAMLSSMHPDAADRFLVYDSNQNVSISVVNWQKYLTEFVAMALSTHSLDTLSFLRWHFETLDPTNEYHPYLGFRILSGHHLDQCYKSMAIVQNGDAEVVSTIMEELKLIGGLPLSKDYVWLNESWQSITPSLNELYELTQLARSCMKKLKLNTPIQDELKNIEQDFQHQLIVHYTPELKAKFDTLLATGFIKAP